jgi:hypothetical protein
VSALAFAIFGALLASSISGDAAAIPVGALLAALAGWLAMWLLRWSLAMTAGPAREADAARGLFAAMGDAGIVMLPFAVLAALAQLGLGWQVTQAFVVAALGAGAAAIGAAAVDRGAGRLRTSIIGGLWALLVGAGWMLAWSALGAAP